MRRIIQANIDRFNALLKTETEPVVAKISQETLAEMIGTTRSRVSHFMNKFRQLSFIDYSNGHLEVRSSLLSVVLAEQGRSVAADHASRVGSATGGTL